MTERVLPPIPYFGSKVNLSPQIASYLPPHTHYVEAFAGGLSLLFAKRPSSVETVNDLDGNVVNFWRVLRDRPQELIQACRLTPYSRTEFYESWEPIDALSDVERARRFFVRLAQGRMARPSGRRGTWRHPMNTDRSHSGEMTEFTNRMYAAAERLCNVYVEHKPALEVIQTYGRHDDILIYMDPPYVHGTRTSSTKDYYAHEMSDADHTELAEAAHKAQSVIVLSGYPGPLYSDLYKDWWTVKLPYWTVQGNGTRQPRMEMLWLNRQPAGQQTLFPIDEEDDTQWTE
jgi:DNA adenine methylase